MNPQPHWFAIPSSLLIAFILTLLPMPDWAVWMRPAWVLMVMIYWLMTTPYRVNIASSWVVGILLDVLNGTLFGEHALALTLVAYFVIRMHTQLRVAPVLQQAFWVLIFSALYQFVIYCVQGFIGELPKTWWYWSSSATNMLLWPWIYSVLRDQGRRIKTA